MRAIVVGGGMGGLFAALALRQSGQFESIDVYEQRKEPSTAGSRLNIPPNGARLCKWLGIDLDGGDPKGEPGAIDGSLVSTHKNLRHAIFLEGSHQCLLPKSIIIRCTTRYMATANRLSVWAVGVRYAMAEKFI